MKNANGTGTVYKKSGNRRKPFVAAVSIGYGSKGKRKEIVIGYYENQQAAKAALAEYTQAPTTKINITLLELWNEWCATKYFTQLAKDTRNNYKASWNKRFFVLGKEKVRDIRTGQMQAIIDQAEQDGMSMSSIKKDKALMMTLFDYASENDIVRKNYAQFIDLPKDNEVSTKDAFTDIELKKIEQAVATVPYADCVLILCYTGFRIQEFLTLTPFSYNESTQELTGGIKTTAGKNREIPIHPKIAALVKNWVNKGGQTIFCKEDKTPFSIKYFREKYYYTALKEIGVRILPPHCARHTFATLLHNAGADPIEIKELMGHTKYQMSAKYTHTGKERMKEAINSI